MLGDNPNNISYVVVYGDSFPRQPHQKVNKFIFCGQGVFPPGSSVCLPTCSPGIPSMTPATTTTACLKEAAIQTIGNFLNYFFIFYYFSGGGSKHWACPASSPKLLSLYPSCFHLVSTLFPPCIHLVSTLFPPCFHLVSTYSPPSLHLVSTLFPPSVHLVSTFFPGLLVSGIPSCG